MSQLIRNHYEKLLLATACGAVAAACVWTWWQQPAVRLVRGERVEPVFTCAALTRSQPGRVGLLPAIPFGWRGSGLAVAEGLLTAVLQNLLNSLREDPGWGNGRLGAEVVDTVLTKVA